MAWTFNAPLSTLSDAPTYERAEKLWEAESLGGLTEDNNPVPRPVVWLVFLTVCTAFCVTFPLWGQRPTAALYVPYVNSMDNPQVLAAKDDTQAMALIVAMNRGKGYNDAQLARHPLTMDDLRLIAPQIKALEAKGGVDLHDYSVVGANIVLANFEGNFRPDGTRIRQQPWWDKGYTIDIFYLSAFFLGVILVVKRLPPTTWEPRHGGEH
ncbi:MAG: hypothetical protein ACLPJY_20035 [Rhodomicrobium sp.]